MDILSSWFSPGIGVIILNVPGDFMCVNTMFDTSCEVPGIIKVTYRPCGQCPDGQSHDKSIWLKLWSRKQKNLEIRVFRLSLAWSALHGCLVSSVSNLLNITSISCPLKGPKTDIDVDLIKFLDFYRYNRKNLRYIFVLWRSQQVHWTVDSTKNLYDQL